MGRGKRQGGLGPRGHLLPLARPEGELIYSGEAWGIKVTELDYDKSSAQIELEGGEFKPENGSYWHGPYADHAEAERDLERAKAYYAKRVAEYHATHNTFGELSHDWRLELLPWPVPEHTRFSDYIAEQHARSQGVAPADVDLREVFGEPLEFEPPGPSTRPSPLAERRQ